VDQIWDKPVSYILSSKILGEEREILVYLPIRNDKTHTGYPVLYHLDGDEIQLGGILEVPERTSSKYKVPELIYVSVVNTDRTRDMSPVRTSFCENPGADHFMNFFSRELIPYIDKNFHTSPFRILCGQSYSSVFTLYTLLEEPSLFHGYITVSLYFPQCQEFFMKKAEESLTNKHFDDRYLFMTLGALDFQYNKDNKTDLAINELIRIIYKNKPIDLKWDYRVYEDYGHCPEPSYGDGLQWIFNMRVPRSTGNQG
jgi:predicted alpha/beta superfamily hydrolase